ncbi:MAG TPA: FAD-binding oxidoreductase [Devosiaceae bacterium]|jgi:D-amino-acid dehydrogenase|nr:FAD-binding oxidoreductase [Devosiaceae bacterium]
MPQAGSVDVAIVGAGIIGLATAVALLDAGRRVLLIDPDGIARGTSSGNAGGLAYSDILPLASKGMLSKVPGWLADPLGPLSIPPSYLPRIAPWLLRFWRAGLADRREAAIAAQAALMQLASTEMQALIARAGLAGMVHEDGVLELYESEQELTASLPGWDARERHGIGFEHVRGARLAELQPGLSPRLVAGTFVPSWHSVDDPYRFAATIGEHATARGAELLQQRVTGLRPVEQGVELQLADSSQRLARQVVVAAGAWSKTLTAPLGDAVPLETERGYNTTLPAGSFDLRRQLTFGGHGFVISKLASGIRVGGAVELGGLELPPNYARADAMLQKAARFLPGLTTEGGTQWMGYRPSLPDSLPVIGASRATPDIVYAFGHGHLGLTQSAATGRLVQQLLARQRPAIDLSPFSPQRF